MTAGTPSLLARALDAEPTAGDDATSARILDAALELAAASGIRRLTMEEVARRAGVGRVTIYRRFGDRQRLVEALAVRETHRCLETLDTATSPDQPMADQIAEGFVASLRLLREHPLLSRLVRFEPEVLLASLTDDRAAIFTLARTYLSGRLAAADGPGKRTDIDLDHAAEVLVRLALSFALIGETSLPIDDENAAREVARRLLAPIVSG